MKEQLLTNMTFVAKGEIAHYEQFVLLPNCFQKSSVAEESVYVCGKGLNVLIVIALLVILTVCSPYLFLLQRHQKASIRES